MTVQWTRALSSIALEKSVADIILEIENILIHTNVTSIRTENKSIVYMKVLHSCDENEIINVN